MVCNHVVAKLTSLIDYVVAEVALFIGAKMRMEFSFGANFGTTWWLISDHMVAIDRVIMTQSSL